MSDNQTKVINIPRCTDKYRKANQKKNKIWSNVLREKICQK